MQGTSILATFVTETISDLCKHLHHACGGLQRAIAKATSGIHYKHSNIWSIDNKTLADKNKC